MATPPGAVRSASGLEIEALICGLRDRAGRAARSRVVRLKPARNASGYLDHALAALAEAALRLWPNWWQGVEAPERDDALGRQAAALAAGQAARAVPGVSSAWAEAAAALAFSGRPPRVSDVARATEAKQLALAIAPEGLALVVDIGEPAHPEALVAALEGLARHIGASLVALFDHLPAAGPPFDRILYGARDFRAPDDARPDRCAEVWIAPARGLPHPISDIERRLAAAIAAAPDLADLFEFNRVIATLRGTSPRVDLVWRAGRLVVEVDGYQSHGNRISFQDDRRRDYELVVSGYTVLRLTNDEVADDLERALVKIRDVVKVCRDRGGGG